MDLLSFEAFCASVQRVWGFMQSERAWTAILAAQGTGDGMKEWVSDRWPSATTEAEKTDLSAFLSQISKSK